MCPLGIPVKMKMCIDMPRPEDFAVSNIKQATGIQLMFMLKIKLQKYTF